MYTPDSVGFFESLSVIGWMGILVWIAVIAILIARPKWFMNYEERMPKIRLFEHLFYEEWHYILFMIARFAVMLLVITVITRIMFQL